MSELEYTGSYVDVDGSCTVSVETEAVVADYHEELIKELIKQGFLDEAPVNIVKRLEDIHKKLDRILGKISMMKAKDL